MEQASDGATVLYCAEPSFSIPYSSALRLSRIPDLPHVNPCDETRDGIFKVGAYSG